jgi:hypothetical protein
LTNIAVSDTIRQLLLVDKKSVDLCPLAVFKSATGDCFGCRRSVPNDAKIFVASGPSPPLHGLWQLVSPVRRGEELREVRADASVEPALEGAR